MFDDRPAPTANSEPPALGLESLTELELFILRERIDSLLPSAMLKDIDLSHEVVRQFQVAKALQTETLAELATEAQKKAATLNACASALAALVKLQTDIYNSERLKTIESRLMKALTHIPEHYLIDFFKFYESDMDKGLD